MRTLAAAKTMYPTAIAKLQEMAENGIRSVVDTHDPDEGEELCDGTRYLWRRGITRRQAAQLKVGPWSPDLEELPGHETWPFVIYYVFRKANPFRFRHCRFTVVQIAGKGQISLFYTQSGGPFGGQRAA